MSNFPDVPSGMSEEAFTKLFLHYMRTVESRQERQKLVRFLRRLGLTPEDEEYQELMKEFRDSHIGG